MRRGIELGATLCAHGRRIELGRTCEGDECRIPAEKFLTGCKEGSIDRAGTFHTHVDELPFASDTDIDITMKVKDEALCIGGKLRGKAAVKCNYNFRRVEALDGAFYHNDWDVCEVES